MDIIYIFWCSAMFLFNILITPQPTLSAPIKFLCNKTDAIGNQNAFLCQFDIQTSHQAGEWKTTLSHFTLSINLISGIMLAMIIVIFLSIIFNIIRYRSSRMPDSSSTASLVPQKRQTSIGINVRGNEEVGNCCSTDIPIASGSTIKNTDESDDYMKPCPVEENLYDQLEHEKELMKQGITTIAIENAVYNEVGDEVVINENLYDAVEFKKPTAIDNVVYGNVD